MSVWIKTEDRMPPENEEVLILYKDKEDELTEDNLFYGIARWIEDSNFHFKGWSSFTEYQVYYEVVFWTQLVDVPNIKRLKEQENE